MGLLDTIKNALQGNKDKIEAGIDKVVDVVDDKTGGQHTDKIQGAADKAKSVVNKLEK